MTKYEKSMYALSNYRTISSKLNAYNSDDKQKYVSYVDFVLSNVKAVKSDTDNYISSTHFKLSIEDTKNMYYDVLMMFYISLTKESAKSIQERINEKYNTTLDAAGLSKLKKKAVNIFASYAWQNS